ncbi:MAG: hypothetical protein IKQ93_02640 [Candidatus Methanomethylophilaceae archaeon]|nr:hypothetical protein [Candidatus Methanomethylophilaceae archaeon]
MNRQGMTAFADAMIFMVVIMMAISVTASLHHHDESMDIGPDVFLSYIGDTEVRLSDLTDIEDDSLVYLPDLMALSLTADTDVEEYLETLLDSAFGSDRYRLVMVYEGQTGVIGSEHTFFTAQYSKTISVSIGGSIYIDLGIL